MWKMLNCHCCWPSSAYAPAFQCISRYSETPVHKLKVADNDDCLMNFPYLEISGFFSTAILSVNSS